GERTVDVTVQRVVGGETKFLWMNAVFASICELQDGSESAWPQLTSGSWIPTDNDKVRPFVLTFLESGCDYLPAISGLPFDKMWVLVLKSVRTEGCLTSRCSSKSRTAHGPWMSTNARSFWRPCSSTRRHCSTPAQVVQSVDGDVEAYVIVIRYTTSNSPRRRRPPPVRHIIHCASRPSE
ncbi:unnamed protein product, partial [Ectocarpus sp. 12 AP-2014]